jgi:drug/metabolite transporter (DMT)-like permease
MVPVTMKTHTLTSDALLLLTAVIWGFAFVAQRVGMDFVGPFTFNGVRFALGCLSLMPLLLMQRKTSGLAVGPTPRTRWSPAVKGGCLAGVALFAGASLQQVGLVYTTAGKAGFITGLYVVIVPLFGLFWKQQPGTGTWIGAVVATAGLYLLSVTDRFTISYGDFLVLAGAFFWAGHMLIIDRLSSTVNPIRLACVQYAACSLLSMAVAVAAEPISMASLRLAALPILYGGLLSVGVAYTLQIVAQKRAHPAHAAILLSLESVFAAVGGWIVLGETLSPRGLVGCALMLSGMLLSQLQSYLFPAPKPGLTPTHTPPTA